MAAELSDIDGLIYWLSQTLTVARKKLLVLLHILIKEKCLHCEYGTCLEKNVI